MSTATNIIDKKRVEAVNRAVKILRESEARHRNMDANSALLAVLVKDILEHR